MKKKRLLLAGLLLALLFLILWLWYWFASGLSNREVLKTVHEESEAIQSALHLRADLIEKRLDRIENSLTRLEKIEAKLDRLLEIATPQLPDGMTPAR